jgi:hypothetical protein
VVKLTKHRHRPSLWWLPFITIVFIVGWIMWVVGDKYERKVRAQRQNKSRVRFVL